MNYTQALDYIYHAKQAGAEKHGLLNITELMKRLGNPEQKIRAVHVAGTNGKGSVCAFLESVLREAGYKTGLYTSPFLERFTERIQVGGAEIPEDSFAAIAAAVIHAAEAMVSDGLPRPTFFELVTACGFLYFEQEKVDIAVIETGLGGRTDATNVLTPLVSVITTIGIDHAHTLGGTIEQIASEKAGIIKPGVPCVISGANAPEAVKVIEQTANGLRSPLLSGSDYHTIPVQDSLDGQTFHLSRKNFELDNLEIGLLGGHQLANAATAVLVLMELNKQGYGITKEALHNGLKQARWPGRLELLRREPPVLIDGAHNPQAAGVLAESVLRYLPGRPVCLLAGAMADKEIEPIVAQFSRFASKVIATEPPACGRDRRRAGVLAELFRMQGVDAVACPVWREALTLALRSGMAVVVAGSIYLSGAVRSALQSAPASASSTPSPLPSSPPPSGRSSVADGEGETPVADG